MIELISFVSLFVLSFYILIRASDYFVDEAANLGKHFGMSRLMIGLTIVAIGTSLPEGITALLSIFVSNDYSQFIIGATLGSNITNMLLIFGLFLIYSGKFHIKKKESFSILSFYITAIVFMEFIILGFVNYFAILLVVFYIFYVLYLKKFQGHVFERLEVEIIDIYPYYPIKSYIILGLSILGLFIGARFTVISIEQIGLLLSISPALLSLTTISIATSLPELAVTISSAKRGEHLIGIGNILGTNIMNICMIIGLSGLLGMYVIDTSLYIWPMVFNFIGVTFISYLMLKRRFKPVYGFILLGFYLLFLITTFL